MSTGELLRFSPKKEEGFSLIEVIISMVIISTAASIVTFSLKKRIYDTRDDAVIQQLETTIALARTQTIETHEDVSLNSLHATLFETRPRRVLFDQPDIVKNPALCPRTKAHLSLSNRDVSYTIGFGSCALDPIDKAKK